MQHERAVVRTAFTFGICLAVLCDLRDADPREALKSSLYRQFVKMFPHC